MCVHVGMCGVCICMCCTFVCVYVMCAVSLLSEAQFQRVDKLYKRQLGVPLIGE